MGFLAAALGIGSLFMQHKQNKIAQEQFSENMDLAKNRHKYEVEDLANAGLNPILSANAGAVSLPSPTAGAMQNSFEKATQALATARQLDVLKAQSHMMNTQADKNTADADLAKKSADTQDWQRRQIDEQIAKTKVETTNLFSQVKVNDANANKILADASYVWKQVQSYDKVLAAEINVKQAQAFAAVESGKASKAQATAAFAQATESYERAGLLSQQQSNAIKQGFGISLDNVSKEIANKRNELKYREEKASEYSKTNPGIQNVRTWVDYFNPLGAIGK